MKPILHTFTFGEATLRLPTYGVLVALGFLVAIVLVVRRGVREGLPADGLLDLAWWMLVSGLLGARLLYLALNAGHYLDRCRAGDCLAALRIWDGGIVFFGGAIAAGFTTWLIARRRGWSFPVLADLFAPGLVIGHAFGRLGCFAAGCCYGKTCGAAFCVAFPEGSVAHAARGDGPAPGHTAPLFPTQLLEAAALFGLWLFLRAFRRRARFPGQLFLVYLATYGGLRFVIEIFRGDVARRYLLHLPVPPLARLFGLPAHDPLFLSSGQAISLVLLAAALATLAVAARQSSPGESGGGTRV